MRARSGYVHAGAIAGVPIFLHWSLPIGPFVLSGFRFSPGLYFGIMGVVLVHELGHAALAKVRGCRVQAIEMHAFGGLCVAEMGSRLDGIVIAWGGVLAQAWLMLFTFAVSLAWPPERPVMQDLAYVLTYSNAVVAVLNLMPVAPLDGAEAWRLPRALGWLGRASVAPAPRARTPVEAPRATVEREAVGGVVISIEEALDRAKREARARRETRE